MAQTSHKEIFHEPRHGQILDITGANFNIACSVTEFARSLPHQIVSNKEVAAIKFRHIFLALVFLTLAGCVTTAKMPEICTLNFKANTNCEEIRTPPKGKSLIVLYRPHLFFQGGAWPDMWIGEYDVGPLKDKTFLTLVVDPGNYVVLAKRTNFFLNWQVPDMSKDLETEPDKIYYVKVTPHLENLFVIGSTVSVTGQGQISFVDEKKALAELNELKYEGAATYNEKYVRTEPSK